MLIPIVLTIYCVHVVLPEVMHLEEMYILQLRVLLSSSSYWKEGCCSIRPMLYSCCSHMSISGKVSTGYNR